MYDALPKNERSFYIDLDGEDTGVKYQGTFVVKCVLDMGGRHSEELEKTRLMADYANPSDGLYGIAVTLSKLRARIVDSPEWWKQSGGGTTIIDDNIILHLFSECERLEKEWRTELKAKAAPPPEETPPKAAPAAGETPQGNV